MQLFSDPNPISLFGIILHVPPPTSFTTFLAVNGVNVPSVKRADVFKCINFTRKFINREIVSGHNSSRIEYMAISRPSVFVVIQIPKIVTALVDCAWLEPWLCCSLGMLFSTTWDLLGHTT